MGSDAAIVAVGGAVAAFMVVVMGVDVAGYLSWLTNASDSYT